MSPLDAIGPDLKGFVDETPEQHTARVLAELDQLMRSGEFGYVSVELDADGLFVGDSTDYTTAPHRTFIGALSALIEAHRNGNDT